MDAIIMKPIIIGCMVILTSLLFYSCSDKLDIQQEYDFSLTSWHLQSAIRKDESVEIRLTLNRFGNYAQAEYYIGYIQMAGKGEVCDMDGTLLINRELHKLSDMAGLDAGDPQKQVFTLFYKSLSTKKSEVKFVVVDNFGKEKNLSVSFENQSDDE